MQTGVALLAGAAIFAASPAFAAPSAYDVELVSEFADACVAARTSFAANKTAAEAAGWAATTPDANAEFAAVIGFSDAAAADIRANNGKFDFATYAKPIDGITHYLILSDALIGYGAGRQNIVGCYMYNFDAAAAADPEAVTALLGAAPTQSQIDMHVSSWQWNKPEELAGVLDVYLTFVPEISQYKDQYGFSGLVLQLNTMIPSPTELPGG
jgi:hypothetical protein